MTGRNSDKFDELAFRTRTRRCSKCGGALAYIAGGMFRCQKCGNEQLDDFGKVKIYLEEHGPTPQYKIHEDTGVDMDIIDYLVRKSRLECTENSPVFYKCEICGHPIKSGSICAVCAKNDSVQQRGYYRADDVGERPKSAGQMHFIGRDKK